MLVDYEKSIKASLQAFYYTPSGKHNHRLYDLI